MNYNEFINTYNGKGFDYDGAAGIQCVDLVKMYLDKVFGLKPGAWGNAKDYYENYNNLSAIKSNFTRIANTPSFVPQKGDIVVWGTGLGNQYGHIAIATGEGNTSQFYSHDLNWGQKVVHKVLHNYKGFLGVLRPIDQSKITGNNSNPPNTSNTLKTLARNTNLRNKPTTQGSNAVLYLANTTLYVLESSVAVANGFTWDKVRIRVNGKEGYMINQNYK